MPYKNRIRLPFYLRRPQFPDERNVFRFADGSTKVQAVVIRKTYEGITGYMPEWVHQRLKFALSHDQVTIEGDRYLGGVVIDDDYNIDWPEFMDMPYAQANFKVQVSPFNATNSNCQSCDEASQLQLVQDNLPATLEQNTTYEFNVFENDRIDCSPFTVSISFFNPFFVASVSITQAGDVSLTTKPLFYPKNGVLLAQYRVTCPNGNYDEVGIYGNVTGDDEGCLEPTNLRATGMEVTSAQIAWDAPSPAPDDGYEWKLALASSPAAIIDSGSTIGNAITLPVESDPLDPATEYIFSVRAKCDDELFSDWVNLEFTTSAQEMICGKYRVTIFDGYGPFKDVTYIGCNGMTATIRLTPFVPRTICALQDGPHQPVSIVGADEVLFLRPC